jgi:colicin import membrane protein
MSRRYHGRPIVWRPVFMTLLLHVAVIYLMTMNWSARSEEVVKPRQTPKYIEARLVTAEMLKPKPKPKPKPKSRPTSTTQAKPKPKAAAPKPKPVVPKPEPTPKPAAPKPEPAGPTQEERAAMARDELAMALEAEDILLEQASDEQVTQSYVALIARVIEENWSRPPSARNNMEAELIIQLIPTGEVVSVSVARSSGQAAFDRSAVMAVQKAERFPELQDLPGRIFNKNFRTLRLKFKPEDLRY